MVGQLVKAPVYQQLNELLRELMRSGEFKIGERFLTERQIAERFGVSRATANKALSNLVSEGILEFRKGLGTFVQGGVLNFDLKLLVSFTARADSLGKKAATKVLAFERQRARDAPDAAGALGVGPDEEILYLERLRMADGVAVILERRYVVARFCPKLDRHAAAGSLYAYFTDRCKLDIAGAEQTIRAVSIRGDDAKLLEVAGGTAGLLVTATGALAGGASLWWERTLYRGDVYEFKNRIGPLQTLRPAAAVFRGGEGG